MKFDTFVGIDWSGDKSNYQRGISVALCKEGNLPPKIIKPKTKYWSRELLFEWINNLIISNTKVLVGFDFAFSYPFYDRSSYFPGIYSSPTNPKDLWKLIDIINKDKANFYGGGIWNKKIYQEYYNAPGLKGVYYESRRRKTEILAKNKVHSPSPTFNCVGPAGVGTGSLAGMRFLNRLKEKVDIWPFQTNFCSNKSTLVEIFPTYYFRMAGIKPDKGSGYNLNKINCALNYFSTNNLCKNIIIGGPDQDDADAIISSAALRHLSKKKYCWSIPNNSKKEGWIFGV